MKLSRLLYLFLTAMLVCLSRSSAQTALTSLHGVVSDQSGAVIPGAQVAIANADTGYKAERVADDRGDYAFEQITPGKYTVVAHATGFAGQKQTLELLVNQARSADFKLNVAATATDSVEVIDSGVGLNLTDATVGTPFDTAQIQALPFEGNNVLDLLSLQSGVLFLGDKSQAQQDSDSRNGAVDGARSDQSNVTLDGLDDNDQNKGYAFSGVLRSTRDSVEEFRVVTTNSNADSGRSSGAQVSLVTRSGTNSYHGSVYEYYRPTNTVANDWFNKQAELSTNEPNRPGKFLRNTFGGSFGAPIKKDKLFYFVAYEGQRTAEDLQVTHEVPMADFRKGNLTYLNASGSATTLTPAQIASMDPNCQSLGSCPLGAGADPAALAYYAKLPMPNGTQLNDTYNLASYTFASPNPINLNTVIAKIDFNPTQKHRLFVRANMQDDHTIGPLQFPGAPPNYRVADDSKGLAAGDVWTVTPNIVNNFRYGLVRQSYANRGITNASYITFRNIANQNGTGFTSAVVSVPTHNLVDDVTWVKGKHTFQFGGNYRLVLNNRSSDATLYNHAAVSYTNLGIGAIAGTGSSLDADAFGFPRVSGNYTASYNNAVADIVGMMTSATQYYNNEYKNGQLTALPAGQWVNHHYLTNEFEYYGQDSWKLRPNLTLTVGLRHTLLQVPYERNGQEVVPTVDMGKWLNNRSAAARQGQLVQPAFGFTQGGRANNAAGFWNMGKMDFSPRFAIAYAPTTKTSIRAGFGLYYDHFGQGIVNSFDQNGEFGLVTSNQSPVGATNADTAPRFTAESAIPLGIIPSINVTGKTPVIPGNNLSLAWGADQSIKTPYSYAFNFGLQRQVTKSLMVEGTYTGRLGRRLLQMRDVTEPINLADPKSGSDYFAAERSIDKLNDAGTAVAAVQQIPYWENMFPWMASNGLTATQAIYQLYFGDNPGPLSQFRGNEASALFLVDTPGNNGGGAQDCSTNNSCFRYFNPQYSSLYMWSSMGTSSYHGLQLALHQQTFHGVQFDAYYTFAKSIDLGSDTERNGTGQSGATASATPYFSQIINVYNPKGNRGPSDFDVRHAVTLNVLGALPFGRGRLIGNHANRFVDAVIGGWNLTGLTHWTSGLPFSAIDDLGWNTDWADQSWAVQTGPIKSGGHSHDQGGQPNAFKDSNAAINNIRPPYAGETGNRNNYRGDGYFSIDSGINKIISLTERQQLKFAGETFNTTNSVRFDPAGISNTPYGNGGSYGRYTSLLTDPRKMQLSLRYSF